MMSEFELIDKLVGGLPPLSERVELGIGDDTAVLKPIRGKILLTVDSLVEKVHFDFSFCEPSEIGHKALAVNLSDIAAMGGVPRAALIALTVPSSLDVRILEGVYSGISRLAKQSQLDIVGGNISRISAALGITITLLGEGGARILTRRGARKGDKVFVSGLLGEAAAGLELLKAKGLKAKKEYPSLCSRYLVPVPRTELGSALASIIGVHSLIDLSDGLSSELWHLSKASQKGFRVSEAALPCSTELKKAADELGLDVISWIVSGGEDYELLGTCSAESVEEVIQIGRQLGLPISIIGEVVSEKVEVQMESPSGELKNLDVQGWNHFRQNHA